MSYFLAHHYFIPKTFFHLLFSVIYIITIDEDIQVLPTGIYIYIYTIFLNKICYMYSN